MSVATEADVPQAETAAGRLLSWLQALGCAPGDSAETRGRKTLLVTVTLMVVPAGLLWGALYWAFGERLAALLPWAYSLLALGALVLFARTRRLPVLRGAHLSLILVTPALVLVALGGVTESSGVVLWSVLAPLGAIAFGSRRPWLWFAAFAVLVGLSVAVAPAVRDEGANLPDWLVTTFGALNIGAVSLVAFTLLALFARQRGAAQRRVESLLLNILPAEIAERLQEEPRPIADHFDDATILFADVVDFTPLSSRLQPTELVEILDRLFTLFDELADRYGVEKIKTIGDCYMVAAGVPQRRADHAQALAQMAFEMHGCAASCLPADGPDRLVLRVGLSSGPVVAGVIGRRRFLYDLWGDAVNMASRMESHGFPGQTHITRSTWELLRDDFVCEPRGLVEVKGKGLVETWTLVAPRHRRGASP